MMMMMMMMVMMTQYDHKCDTKAKGVIARTDQRSLLKHRKQSMH